MCATEIIIRIDANAVCPPAKCSSWDAKNNQDDSQDSIFLETYYARDLKPTV